ncbi:MAG: YceI family protein [Bacteroidia bacterium]
MKNQSITTAVKKVTVRLVVILASLMVMSFINTDSTSNYYQIISSRVFIEGSGKINDWKLPIDTFNCKGNFIAKSGVLEDITDLQFTFPISKINTTSAQNAEELKTSFSNKNCSEISFSQKSLMILPIMKVVHLVGELKIGTDVHAVPMQMQYNVNADGSISLNAKQYLKLSEFGIKLANVKAGDVEEEVTINIALNLKKKQHTK